MANPFYPRVSREKELAICEAYRSGTSTIELARINGYSVGGINLILRRNSVELRSLSEARRISKVQRRRPKPRERTPEEREFICKSYLEGKSAMEISRLVGTRAEIVKEVLSKNGIVLRPQAEAVRLARHSPNRKGPTRLSAQERFWSHVEKSDGCWMWTGCISPSGYGHFKYGHGPEKIARQCHRYSWELANGPIPDGLWVLHKCDNPPCVRPDHLFLGTRADNTRDMIEKGRCRNKYTRILLTYLDRLIIRRLHDVYSADRSLIASIMGISLGLVDNILE